MSVITAKDSVDAGEPTSVAINVRQKLAVSRSKLVKHMRGDTGSRSAAPISDEEEQGVDNTESKRLSVPSGTWQVMKLGLSSWWRHHPANMALALATPLLRRYADRKPFQLLAISAGVGAAVALSKPWRLISVGGFALATLKSSEFSALVASLLTSEEKASQSAVSAKPHS